MYKPKNGLRSKTPKVEPVHKSTTPSKRFGANVGAPYVEKKSKKEPEELIQETTNEISAFAIDNEPKVEMSEGWKAKREKKKQQSSESEVIITE